MEKLIRFTTSELSKITNFRSGEIKFGEKMILLPKDQEIKQFITNCEAKFVLFGIPEDIGIRANHGRPGAFSAWDSAIKSIANIQHNRFNKGNEIILLGKLDVSAEMKIVESLQFEDIADRKKMSELVVAIDKEVAHLVAIIVAAGKIPILIGGGHNNAYGAIKGTALAKGKSINAINFDAHSDFRILEGRHSGNAFSYAFEEGFLKKYFVFGLHESYTTKSVLTELKRMPDQISFNTYDEIKIKKEKSFDQELLAAKYFVDNDFFGVELDLDSIPNIACSAMTPSGFSAEEARQFIYYFGKNPKSAYLHICEGAPELDAIENSHMVGKLIAYLVSDFMKAKMSLLD
ncbi:MAG: formiminoglutamase [Flavobacterium sp.]|jgi:formiminoglutamase